MEPLSRAKPPEEYTIRVLCQLSAQFDLQGERQQFSLANVSCTLQTLPSGLLLEAKGFTSMPEAQKFFPELRSWLLRVAICKRLPIVLPIGLSQPKPADVPFLPDDSRCQAHGWPAQAISPLIVPKFGACVYPEHEFVAVQAIYGSLVPSYSLDDIARNLKSEAEKSAPGADLSMKLLLACQAYCHAARSTQWVWSFLLTVMTIEMLAEQTPTSEATRKLVENLISETKAQCQLDDTIESERIISCIREARKNSITKAAQDLVERHCSPQVAKRPLPIFDDNAHCRKVVAAIYNLRSKYVHEGYIQDPRSLKPFDFLHSTALACLRHILLELLRY